MGKWSMLFYSICCFVLALSVTHIPTMHLDFLIAILKYGGSWISLLVFLLGFVLAVSSRLVPESGGFFHLLCTVGVAGINVMGLAAMTKSMAFPTY